MIVHRLLAAALLLAACQQVPRPFADLDRSAVAEPSDSAGIVVLPVKGLPQASAAALAEAMADALRHMDIPASTEGGNRGSYRLIGTAQTQEAEAGHTAVALDWELRAADGRSLGHVPARSEGPSSAWTAGSPALAKEAAASAVPAIAKLVSDEPPAAAATADPVIALRTVTGAPGDGGTALTRAMDTALRRAHVALAGEKDAMPDYILTGTVALAPGEHGQQRVAVHWLLLGSDGRQLGKVDQENAVPAGSLDGAWGDVAFAVAEAAAPGLVALIERAKAEPRS